MLLHLKKTVRNRLKIVGLRSQRPRIQLMLSNRQRFARLQWAADHRWTAAQWRNVLFTVES